MQTRMIVIKDNIEKCMEVGIIGCSEGRAGVNVTRLSELLPGDKVIMYATGISKFAGIAEVAESIYQDESKIWDDGIYPYRIKIKPVIYLPKDKWIEVRTVVDDMEYFKNKVQWSMHFMQNIRPVSDKDYAFLETKMKELVK